MSDEPQTLQDLARLASERHDGKRGRALGRIAAKHGLTLTYTTFDNIYSGKYMSTPKRETVDALAVLASVPKETAYKVAGLPLPQAPFAEQLPPDVDTLDADQRRVLIEMARVLVKQNRQIHDLEKAGDGSERSATSMKQDKQNTPTRDELAELRRRQREADETPLDEILGYAAHKAGESELQRQDREAAKRGEESQDEGE